MAKYAYPAIITKEDDGYSVTFPDLDGCMTCGDTLPEAMEMAEDALCLMLYDKEEDGEHIPAPSELMSLPHGDNDILTLVCCDTIEYRKLYDNQAVRKSLTIPSWLNTLAEREGLNFSKILQDALKLQLNIYK